MGDANGFRPRDEFTIDFEGLDRGVCATLDAFLDDVSSDAAYKRARRAVGLPESEPPAPELPPRPLPPRPRGLDPPVVVRVPRPPGFRCGGRTLLRPAGAELPGTISITDDGAGRRVVVAAVADGQLLARGRPRLGKPRHPARPASDDEAPPPPPIMEEESEEDDNESDGGAWEAPRPASSEASTENIVFRAVPVPRGLRAALLTMRRRRLRTARPVRMVMGRLLYHRSRRPTNQAGAALDRQRGRRTRTTDG